MTLPSRCHHQLGWQCPKCGRGNAPFVHQCPCGPSIDDAIAACEAVWREQPPLTSGMQIGVEKCVLALRACKVKR